MEATQVKPEGSASAPSAPEKKIPQFQAPRKKRKWVKRLIIILVIVALLAFLLSRCMGAGQQALSSVYLPYTAEMRDMTVSVSGTGTIEPISAYRVTSLVSGEILEAPFEEGQTVHKGDVLFRIDAGSVENNIQQLQLNVQSAQLVHQLHALGVGAQPYVALRYLFHFLHAHVLDGLDFAVDVHPSLNESEFLGFAIEKTNNDRHVVSLLI